MGVNVASVAICIKTGSKIGYNTYHLIEVREIVRGGKPPVRERHYAAGDGLTSAGAGPRSEQFSRDHPAGGVSAEPIEARRARKEMGGADRHRRPSCCPD